MSFNISSRDFLTRAKDLSRNNLLFIFTIIKAASIGLGVGTFLYLFIDLGPVWSWSSLYAHLPKFLLWVTSYAGLLVTFDSAMFSSLFLVHIPKRNETFGTFLLVGLEALQFALLKPMPDKEVTKVMSIDLVVWWYAVFGIYCTNIFFLIHYGKQEINPKDFKGFAQLVKEYITKLKLGLYFSLTGALLSFTIFALLAFTSIDNHFVIISSSILFSTVLGIAFNIHHKQRRKIELLLREKENHKAESPE
ncbi:MAG: hypothetical protein U0X40_02675 [Ferruginibacter sp.]